MLCPPPPLLRVWASSGPLQWKLPWSSSLLAGSRRRVAQLVCIRPAGLPACLPASPVDPSMHAISYACTSPNDKWWAGQSMDNQSEQGGAAGRFAGRVAAGRGGAGMPCHMVQALLVGLLRLYSADACPPPPPRFAVVTYSADRLKPNRKKTFKGHLVAGAAACRGWRWWSGLRKVVPLGSSL